MFLRVSVFSFSFFKVVKVVHGQLFVQKNTTICIKTLPQANAMVSTLNSHLMLEGKHEICQRNLSNFEASNHKQSWTVIAAMYLVTEGVSEFPPIFGQFFWLRIDWNENFITQIKWHLVITHLFHNFVIFY